MQIGGTDYETIEVLLLLLLVTATQSRGSLSRFDYKSVWPFTRLRKNLRGSSPLFETVTLLLKNLCNLKICTL
jgi:hypothetical protein